jgi:Fur family transcriptional regulator, iron response regulator
MSSDDGVSLPGAWPRRPGDRLGCPLSGVIASLRRAGLRPTRQRVSLGWLLFGQGHRHVTADELYGEAMKARIPLSPATVYNTLRQFTQAGLLRELAIDGSKSHFDTNTSEHHHYYLQEEGRVIDMPSEGLTVMNLPLPPPGMEIARVEVLVRLRKAKPGHHDPATPSA